MLPLIYWMNFAKHGVNVGLVQPLIRLKVHAIQMKSDMNLVLTKVLTDLLASPTLMIALSITVNAMKTWLMQWFKLLIVLTRISLQIQTAAVLIMSTSAKQLFKTATQTTDRRIQTKDQVKFNAVERTQIDSLSPRRVTTVVAEM